MKDELKRRLLHIFVAIDQLAWVLITLGNGYPDETISAALYRMDRQNKRAGRWLRPIVDALLSPFEREHCRNAYMAEFKNLQLPGIYKK